MDLGIPLDIARKINEINSHPRGLSLIGILPNQLRQLLKQSGQDADEAFNNISMELFGLVLLSGLKETNVIIISGKRSHQMSGRYHQPRQSADLLRIKLS
jgi:hypothetical protein